MKKQYFKGLLVLLSVLFIWGCKESKETDFVGEQNPSGISNLRAISAGEGVLLSWKNPDNRRYDQIEISYVQTGEKKSILIEPDEQNSAVAIDLPDANVYKFHLLAKQSASNRYFDEMTIKGRKLTALDPGEELQGLLNSIEINGGDGGVRVMWENPENIPATIRVAYDDQTVELDATQLIRIRTIDNLDLNRVYDFQVSLLYDDHISSETRVISATAMGGVYKRLENDGWTITASSEQSGQPAVNLLDNNPATYWRSAAYVGAGQHVIIDLKKIYSIAALTLSRRFGNDENSSWDIRISTSVDGLVYTEGYLYRNDAPPSRPSPNPLLRIEFNRFAEGEQTYPLPEVQTAQYVRVDFVRGGATAYAVYGDVNFYGK